MSRDQPAAIGAFTRPLCHASLRRNSQEELDFFGGINKYRVSLRVQVPYR